MHVLESLHRNVKTVAMPSAMVVGALFCRQVTALEAWSGQMITPTLIFLMLFVTFCRVKPRQMKPSMLHLWLLLIQAVACVGVYVALHPFDPVVAQGAMICVLAPVAMAAVVIAGMLGADVATMATYSLLCNMAVAVYAPVVISFTGTGVCSFTEILARIAPLLIMPFAAAQFCRFVFPKGVFFFFDKGSTEIYTLALVLIVWADVRIMSKNHSKRYAENQKFLELKNRVVGFFRGGTRAFKDKEHCYFRCPSCHQQVRVPKGKGHIEIRCPKCGTKFIKNT